MKFAELMESQLVKQSRTGQVMEVKEIDSARGRATLVDSNGEGRVVSATTIERWYNIVEAEEDKAPAAEALVDNSQPNATEEVEEKKEEDMEQQRTDPVTNDAADQQVQPEPEAPVEEKKPAPVKEKKSPKDLKEPKPKKEPKSTVSDEKIANTKVIRDSLIKRVLDISPSIKSKETQVYTALSENANFAEVYQGKGTFKVSVISQALTPEQLERCKVAPPKFNWTIDAMFTVIDEGDIEEAFNLLANSREYRLRNPLKRKPPVNKKQQAAAEAAQKTEA